MRLTITGNLWGVGVARCCICMSPSLLCLYGCHGYVHVTVMLVRRLSDSEFVKHWQVICDVIAHDSRYHQLGGIQERLWGVIARGWQ